MNNKTIYMRERRRVQRLINFYKRKGYDVSISVPKLVKRPTQKSIDRLKSISYKKVRSNAFAPDLETGEKINYYSYKIRYPKIAPKQAREVLLSGAYANDMNITYFERVVSNYPDRIQDMIMSKLRGAIEVYGTIKVDDALGEMIASGSIIEPSDGYNYRLVSEMMEDLAMLLRLDKQTKEDVHTAFMEELDSQEFYDGEFDSW